MPASSSLQATSFFHGIEMKNKYNRVGFLTEAPLESRGSEFVSSLSAEDSVRGSLLCVCQLFSELHAQVKKIKGKEDKPHLLNKTLPLFSFLCNVESHYRT